MQIRRLALFFSAFGVGSTLALAAAVAPAPPAPPPVTPPAAAAGAGASETADLPNPVPADAWRNGWARGAVFYEVDVRRFADSNGDGSGDLRGLTGKLDSLSDGDPASLTDLQIDALCLASVLKVGVAGTAAIDPAVGTDADLAHLVAAAHKRGLKVILGLPADPGQPAETGRFASAWLAKGVDGFRLESARPPGSKTGGDAWKDTPALHGFLKDLAATIRHAKPEALLIGEIGSDTGSIARSFGSPAAVPGGDELPMSLDAPLGAAILAAVASGDASGVLSKLAEIGKAYPIGALDGPYLSGLDASRAASALGGDPAKRMSAAALLLTLPGSPFLLSGEEVGPAGGAQDSILGAYRQLIRARHHSNSLRYGALEALRPPHQSASILSFVRRYAGSRVLVVHNLSAAALEAGPFFIKGKLVPLYSSPGVSPPSGGNRGLRVLLPAYASGVWRL
ncbi:MAG TPA: alpha-amylase family glycosyl hydrolase [Thermoanaerobaculia bacterium]|nr:alpha-amylase family glycosyl hydrolase [Thermoanaerobaculia bacterium]